MTRKSSNNRAFPRWHRRIDPTVAAEDTNAVYQMFREIRGRRSSRPFLSRLTFGDVGGFSTGLLRAVVGVVASFLLMMAGGFILALTGLGCLGIVIFPAAIYGGVLVSRRIVASRVTDSQRVGTRVSSLLTTSSYNANVLVDLWMCGIKGREIGEALALEQREFHAFANVVFFALLTVPMTVVYFKVAADTTVSLLAFIWWFPISISAILPTLFGGPGSAAGSLRTLTGELRAKISGRRLQQAGKDFGSIIVKGALAGIVIVASIIVVIMEVAVLAEQRNAPLLDSDFAPVIVLFLLAPVFPIVWGSINKSRGPARLERALVEFDLAYNTFVEQRLLAVHEGRP